MGKVFGAGGSALVAAVLAATSASSQDAKTAYFLSWGGTIQTMLEKEGWADQFNKETGCTVKLVPKATSGEIIATAIAQKDNPQIDVVMSDLAPFQQGIEQGIFTDLKPEEIPNLKKMVDTAKIGTKAITPYADILSVIYNKDVFERNKWPAPKTWSDLFRPELKGKVIVPPVSNTYGLYYLVELAKENGGGEHNIDPGFEALKKLAPSVVDWTTTYAKIADLMQQETAVITVFGNSSGWEIAKRGVPADVVVPDRSYMSPTVAGIMRGAPHPECAHALLNWLIGDKVLKYRAERFGQSPMNREVKVEGENARRVLTGEELNKLAQIDYDYITQVRNDWIARFQREVAPIR